MTSTFTADLAMSSPTHGTRQRSKWALDFSSKASKSSYELPNPPGYSASIASLHAEATRTTDPGLKAKRSWDMALGPIKQVPMNLFIMYMSGEMPELSAAQFGNCFQRCHNFVRVRCQNVLRKMPKDAKYQILEKVTPYPP